ncbi:MFS transporter [Caulobacter sp. 1776]|uniref:MFS transporter n=1 Tax=Caulobacter sp. 1776 TaxID=3156420 RepID=UPI0033963F13
MSEAPSSQRKSAGTLAAFAAPTIPLSALGLPLVVYLPEFYVSTIGLSLSAVGAAFLLVRLIDIAFDPFVGGMMDRTRTRLGRFRPWMLAGMPIVGVGAFALFMGKPGTSALYLWAWLLVTYAGYSMAVLSHTAWGGVLSSDYQQRSRIYGWWQGGNVVGMILVLCLPPLMAKLTNGDHVAGIRAMGWFIVTLLPVTILLAVWRVGEPPAPVMRHEAGIRQYLALLTRPSVRRLLAADLLMGVAPGIAGALFIFFFERIKHFDKAQSGILLLVYFLAALAGAPLWPILAKKLGKHRAMALGGVLYAIVQFAAVLTPPGNSGIGMVILILAGLPYTAAPMLVRSMMADIGDEERLESGVDRTGLLYAIVTGTLKLGYALAIGVFPVLAWLGFDPKAPTATGETALTVLYAVVPAAMGLLVAAIMLRYPLDANRLAEIQRQLAARDAATDPAQPAAESSPNVALTAPGPAE